MLDNIFFNAFKRLFFTEETHEGTESLKGRVTDLNSHADILFAELTEIRSRLLAQLDPSEKETVMETLDPIIREVKALKEQEVGVHAIHNLSTVLERASTWRDHYVQEEQNGEITGAVVAHYKATAFEKVSRDIALIKEYYSHSSAYGKEEIESLVSKAIMQLILLQEESKNIQLKDLKKWRSTLDEKRKKIVEIILHKIDASV